MEIQKDQIELWNSAIELAAKSAKAMIVSVPEKSGDKTIYRRNCVVIDESILKLRI